MANNHTVKYQTCKTQVQSQIEEAFLKGTKDEELGVYCDIFSAKCDAEGQGGGVVTALLAKGLEKGMFDSVIIVQRKHGYNVEVVVAKTANEVSAARGTIYLRAQVIPKLRELVKQGAKRIAVVCTPCEILSARKIQQSVEGDCEVVIVGLFCFEAFKVAKLKQEVKTRLDVDLDKIEKTQIRKGKFTVVLDGKEVSCRVKDLEEATEKACRYCDDFTSQLADVSVGSVGSQNGYSTVIVRSEAGEKLVESLDCDKRAVDKEEIAKLSKFKRARAAESFATLNNHQ